MGRGRLANLPGATLHQRPSIGRILQGGDHGGNGRFFPDQLAMHVAARDGSLMVIEKAQDLARRLALQKGREDQCDAVLDFQIGIFLDPMECIAP